MCSSFLLDVNFIVKSSSFFIKSEKLQNGLPVLFLQSRLGRGTCLTPTGGSSSSSSGGSGVITRSYNANIAAALVNRKLRIGKLPPSGEHSPPSAEAAVDPTAQIPLEKGNNLHQV